MLHVHRRKKEGKQEGKLDNTLWPKCAAADDKALERPVSSK